jgi:hypothetical protein
VIGEGFGVRHGLEVAGKSSGRVAIRAGGGPANICLPTGPGVVGCSGPRTKVDHKVVRGTWVPVWARCLQIKSKRRPRWGRGDAVGRRISPVRGGLIGRGGDKRGAR